MDLKSIGKRLRNAREAAGLSRRAAAEAIGASLNALQSWEEGSNEGGFLKLAKLVQLYRGQCPTISVEEILGLNPREFPAGMHIFDQALYETIIELPDQVNESGGARHLQWDPPMVSLSSEIPDGATVLPEREARERQAEVQDKLLRIRCLAPMQR